MNILFSKQQLMTKLESARGITEIWAYDAWHHDTVRGLTHATALTVMHVIAGLNPVKLERRTPPSRSE